jgi:hypothetical protein
VEVVVGATILLDRAEVGPVPAAFVAETVNEYEAPATGVLTV